MLRSIWWRIGTARSPECYYVRPSDFGASVTLRVTPAANGQKVGVVEAARFRMIPPESSVPARDLSL
ncbi:hypothetical protein GCM10028772_33950 [Nocardioides ultimimeridianus]